MAYNYGVCSRGRTTLWVNLLDPNIEDFYARQPDALTKQIDAVKKSVEWVVIDEIQKFPRLLDQVHLHIEKSKLKFAMTGSSARKLKRGAANLLAGRAYLNHLHALTSREMGSRFDLLEALRYGTLPKAAALDSHEEKAEFLKTYALAYLKEEIWAEHIIRALDPFRRFLEIAAQSSGQIINYSNIARDCLADTKTVQSYFQILKDTLLGFFLEPFHHSLRKRQRKNPKFYFFDLGVSRALAGLLNENLVEGSFAYGNAFEQFVILEAFRLNDYLRKDFRFSYLTTKDGAEIDLIIERPGLPTALVEIKSSVSVDERNTRTLERFMTDFKKAEAYCFSRDPKRQKIGRVLALPWQDGLKEIGLV